MIYKKFIPVSLLGRSLIIVFEAILTTEGISSSTRSAKLSGADLAKRLGTNKK